MSDNDNKPRLLDLFCGAGGAAMGYHRAGFDVVGVDISPQPNYPFEFAQVDALAVLGGWDLGELEYDAIHASPPCQFRTAYKRRPGHVAESPNLIPETRRLLEATGLPYVIENVSGAVDELTHSRARLGFGRDMAHLELADTVVLILPCGRSAHTEFGYAVATGKRTLVWLTDPCRPELMYSAAEKVCLTLDEVVEAVPALAVSSSGESEQ